METWRTNRLKAPVFQENRQIEVAWSCWVTSRCTPLVLKHQELSTSIKHVSTNQSWSCWASDFFHPELKITKDVSRLCQGIAPPKKNWKTPQRLVQFWYLFVHQVPPSPPLSQPDSCKVCTRNSGWHHQSNILAARFRDEKENAKDGKLIHTHIYNSNYRWLSVILKLSCIGYVRTWWNHVMGIHFKWF